jgi:hypothetical protein
MKAAFSAFDIDKFPEKQDHAVIGGFRKHRIRSMRV